MVRRLCGSKVEIIDIPTDDMWARDSGPVFLRNNSGARALLDLNFNGWGGKQGVAKDKLVPAAIAKHLDHQYIKADIVGEAAVSSLTARAHFFSQTAAG